MQALAKELIDLRPDLIYVTAPPATAAVLRETHLISIVFSVASAPLRSGLKRSACQARYVPYRRSRVADSCWGSRAWASSPSAVSK
jgi:hypothetical protein